MEASDALAQTPILVAGKHSGKRAVVIGRQRINTRLDVGEILPEQLGHVGVKAQALRDRRCGLRLRPRAVALSLAHHVGKPPHHQAMTHVPGHAGQMPSSISEPRCELSRGTGHVESRERGTWL